MRCCVVIIRIRCVNNSPDYYTNTFTLPSPPVLLVSYHLLSSPFFPSLSPLSLLIPPRPPSSPALLALPLHPPNEDLDNGHHKPNKRVISPKFGIRLGLTAVDDEVLGEYTHVVQITRCATALTLPSLHPLSPMFYCPCHHFSFLSVPPFLLHPHFILTSLQSSLPMFSPMWPYSYHRCL